MKFICKNCKKEKEVYGDMKRGLCVECDELKLAKMWLRKSGVKKVE